MNDRFRVVQREVLEFALLCNDWQNHPAPCLQFLAIFDDTFFKFKCLNVQSAVLRVESKACRARLFISLCLAVPQIFPQIISSFMGSEEDKIKCRQGSKNILTLTENDKAN